MHPHLKYALGLAADVAGVLLLAAGVPALVLLIAAALGIAR